MLEHLLFAGFIEADPTIVALVIAAVVAIAVVVVVARVRQRRKGG
jgi:hypothetical protein